MTRVLTVMASAALAGCFADRSGTGPGPDAEVPPLDAGVRDASAGDASADAGREDGGGAIDGGTDAGQDAGRIPDAGPPILMVTTNLLYHFDAFDPAGDGSPPTPGDLSDWVNLSGSDDASCMNVQYEPDGLRPGYPAVHTTGSEDSECSFSIGGFSPGDLTIAVVLRTDDVRSDVNWYNSPVIVGGDKNGDHDDAALVMSGGSVGFSRRNGGQQFLSPSPPALLPGYADDVPRAFLLVRHATGEVALSVDRSDALRGSADSGRINQPSKWYLASHEGSGGYFRAHYAEVLIYDRALESGEVAAVLRYLIARWAI